jgi:hypothetical protein
VLVSQTVMLPSSDPEAISCISGEKVTDTIISPVERVRVLARVLTSHKWTVPSLAPEIILLPSGENSIAWISPLRPSSWAKIVPDSMSHNWPCQYLVKLRLDTGRKLTHANHTIIATRSQVVIIRAEGHAAYIYTLVRMGNIVIQDTHLLTSLCVENSGCAVTASRHVHAIVTEPHAGDRKGMFKYVD